MAERPGTTQGSGSLFDPRDWHAVEDVLNQASAGASEPFYSQVESAKAALFRLACAAQDYAPHAHDMSRPVSTPAGDQGSLRASLDRLAATVASVPPSVKMLKLGEEYGEAVQAFIGVSGWNPRKLVYATEAEVARELADVALSALVAMGGFCPDALGCLADRLAVVADRAEEAARAAA